MNDHERMHIDRLIHEACELLSETAIQRCGGAARALARLRDDPEGEGIWLGRFVRMFLAENALDGEAGACAILEALGRRPMPEVREATIGETLRAASAQAFAAVVLMKTDEALERASSFESAAP